MFGRRRLKVKTPGIVIAIEIRKIRKVRIIRAELFEQQLIVLKRGI
jgi:hypothetical protein